MDFVKISRFEKNSGVCTMAVTIDVLFLSVHPSMIQEDMLEMKTNCGYLGSNEPNAMLHELREEIRRLSSNVEMLEISYYTIRNCVFGIFLFCLVIILFYFIFSIVLVKV